MRRSGAWARRLLCVCMMVLLLAAQTSAFAKVGATYVCRVNGLRIHKEASGTSEIVGRLKKGDKIVHKSTKNGWWMVKNKSGDLGYVWRKYLKNVTPVYTKNAFYKVYKISKIAVRSGPRSAATKRGTISRGTVVKLKKKQGNWGYVQLSATKAGWMPLKYLAFYRN